MERRGFHAQLFCRLVILEAKTWKTVYKGSLPRHWAIWVSMDNSSSLNPGTWY